MFKFLKSLFTPKAEKAEAWPFPMSKAEDKVPEAPYKIEAPVKVVEAEVGATVVKAHKQRANKPKANKPAQHKTKQQPKKAVAPKITAPKAPKPPKKPKLLT